LNVGLATTTATAGLRSGTVTVDNLDITTQAGAGLGANDANDVFNVSLSVLDHANGSFAGGTDLNSLTLDFGTLALGSGTQFLPFDVFNLMATAGFTAPLDLLSIAGSGDTSVLGSSLSPVNNLAAGTSQGFLASFNTSSPGMFAASYQLSLSDDTALAGALGGQTLTLNLLGNVAAVPEPTAWVLLMTVIVGVAGGHRRSR
jgi:hypothetical protein